MANYNTPGGIPKPRPWPQFSQAGLRLSPGTAPVAISAEGARGAQVVTNPLTGAAKYTRPGGGTAG